MSEITIALGIPHAKHIEGRAATFCRLVDALEIGAGPLTVEPSLFYRAFDRKCPYWEWSSEMWHWQLDTGASHALTLQDDVQPMPGFWRVLRAMISALPDKIIALETVHPAARHFARERLGPWVRTIDGLIGVQYVFPREILREFLQWRAGELWPDGETKVTEDTLIDMFALDSGHALWHPVPAIAEHDVEIPSTNRGHDMHPHRNVCVTWADGDVCGWTAADLERPEFWAVIDENTNMGRFYSGTPSKALQWVKAFDEAKYLRAMNSHPPERFRRWMGGT